MRWPFHGKRIRVDLKIAGQVSFHCPGMHRLAAFLFDAAKLNPFLPRRGETDFFFEFVSSTFTQFSAFGLAFWYRPNASIFVPVKRPPGMTEQYFQRVVRSSKHQQSSTDFRSTHSN